MITRSQIRRGVTLVELLLSLIVTAIVGAALVRMVLSQARFMDQQEAWRGARAVARGGVNRLVSDLRIVEATGGLTGAVAGGQDFTVRVPYAFGIICTFGANTATVNLLPVDSAMYNAPGYSGFAIRADDGSYTYYTGNVLDAKPPTAANTVCTSLPAPTTVTVLPALNGSPAGQVVAVTATAGAFAPTPKAGQIVFLYRRIHYEFKNSVLLPGRTGLFRTALDQFGAPSEELATPFANTARVNFYMLNSAASTATAPATAAARANVRGLELVLDGMSERTPGGSTAPKTANVRTSVFFENRPD
jgi:hypothetical protein